MENQNTEEMPVPVLDYEDCFKFITEKTGIDKKTAMRVLDAETEYMIKIGIIDVGE